MKKSLIKMALVGAGFAVAGLASAATLDDVKKQGYIKCGVSQGVPGFSNPDEKGNWTGIDVDACRAAAAAVFGDASKVKYTPLTAKERFTALSSGEIDILARNTTWTYTRDASLGLDFTTVNFYDGQAFMVRKSLGVKSAKELDGATLCTNTGTTTELNMADYFKANGMTYTPVAFEGMDEVVKAYDAGRCDVFTTDASGLAAQRTKLTDPAAHVILPERISKEPLGPVVRAGDSQWRDIVTWSLFAMLEAEEMGITSKNVDNLKSSESPAIKRFLGVDGDMGSFLGLSADWAANIIKQVGNYGESYERNVGPKTPIGLERAGTVNALWSKGGSMYAPPLR